MTKNKPFIFFLLAASFLSGFIACTPKIDVEGSCKKVAVATLLGTDSVRSVAMTDGLKITLVEYKFLPDNKAVRTTTTFGDGIYETPTSMNLSYQVGEYAEMNAGLLLLFTPEDSSIEPYEAKFFENMLIENGKDTLTDQTAKVDNFEKLLTTFPDTVVWEFEKKTLYIDYIPYLDTIISRKVIIVDGKKKSVKDTTILQKTRKDTLGVQRYVHSTLSFRRDANTLANTGHYMYEEVAYTKPDSVTPAQKIDSLCINKECDMHWNFTSVITARQFHVVAIADDASKEKLTFKMFKYTAPTTEKAGSVIINSIYTYKIPQLNGAEETEETEDTEGSGEAEE